VFRVGGVGLFAKIMPVCFGHFDTVVFCRRFDIGEGLFALVIGDILDLVEAGNGVADVRGVVERLFALFWKGVDRRRKLVALLGVEGFVVLVVFPCCFHYCPPGVLRRFAESLEHCSLDVVRCARRCEARFESFAVCCWDYEKTFLRDGSGVGGGILCRAGCGCG